jgi:protein OS-9
MHTSLRGWGLSLVFIFLWLGCQGVNGESVSNIYSNDPLYHVEFLQPTSVNPDLAVSEGGEEGGGTHKSSSADSVVIMTSRSGQRYSCAIPRPKDLLSSSGSNLSTDPVIPVTSLLEPLRSNCIYRIEGWWTYEFCYGQHLLQFHQDGDQRLSSFILGRAPIEPLVDSDDDLQIVGSDDEEATSRSGGSDAGGDGSSTVKSPKSVFDPSQGSEQKYYSITYKEGTICDLTKEPRTTEIQFICSPQHRVSTILSIKEPSSCHYVVSVATSLLCKHPDYRPEEVVSNAILCTEILEDGKSEEAEAEAEVQEERSDSASGASGSGNSDNDSSD